MLAIDSASLTLSEVPTPRPGPDQLLIRVHATAVNRADLLQRQGKYPPPPGESTILGLEVAGEVAALGTQVTGFVLGQRVFGLVGGGGYAEYCLMDPGLAMSIPDGYSFTDAAAVPEAFLTANEALFTLGNVQATETVLIHAGASGVGTAAIQLAHAMSATVFTTVGSSEKKNAVIRLGAKVAIDYKQQDFTLALKDIDVIIDFMGASYLTRNLHMLNPGGRLICVGLMGGVKAEINLSEVLTKRLQIKGLIMRHRSLADKRAITQRFCTTWLPALAKRGIHPVIDSIYPLRDAQKAHQRMEAHANIGKIVLDTESGKLSS